MKNIIFIAPPAAGKGTQSKFVSEEYNIPHISTGDLLRDEVASQTELGLSIKSIMDNGQFVSDDIITKLLRNRLSKEDCNNGYILDGYPRNIKQAEIYEGLLNELHKDLGVVIFLDIDKDLALKRTLSRIVCSNCGISYNLLVDELKPVQEGICDKCCSKLNVRADDNEQTFISRFDTYIAKTQDLIDYYKNKGCLHEVKVDEQSSAEAVFEKIKVILND